MTFDIWCGDTPSATEAQHIYDLMGRTMKKVGKPFFAHTLVISGPATDQAFDALSHAGCNVSKKATKHRVKHAVVISGPAPKDFMRNRKQVLNCPRD